MKIILTMVAFVLFAGISTADTGKDLADIRESIEKSSWSQEKKTILTKKASDAVKLGIPSSDVSIIIKRGLSRGLDEGTMGQSLDIVMKAKEKGLPVRPVLDRIQQGLSKGVPPQRLSAASNQLVEKLYVADSVVGNLVKNGMKTDRQVARAEAVHSVARALEKSIPEDTITKVGMKVAKQDASLARFDATVNSMTAFVEMGMPIHQASRLIHKAVDKGYTEKDMQMMEREIYDGVKDGNKMDDIMKNMESMMNSGTMGRGMNSGSMSGPGSGMGSNTQHNMPGMGPMGTHPGMMPGGMGGRGR